MNWLRIRTLIVIVAFALGLVYTIPSFLPNNGNANSSSILPNKHINLGLDLKGGIHLTLGVEMDKALVQSLGLLGKQLKEDGQAKNIQVLSPRATDAGVLELSVPLASVTQFEELLKKEKTIQVSATNDAHGLRNYSIVFTPEHKIALENTAMDQVINTLRNRVDEFGVAEPDIRKLPDNRIQVQLPGLGNPDRAIALINRTAHLDFRLVDDSVTPEQMAAGIIPADSYIAYMVDHTQKTRRPIILKKEVLMGGDSVADARISFDRTTNAAQVAITMTPSGAKIFERITSENVNKRLAIVLDGIVQSAPNINEKISGGQAQISGHFTDEEATDLSLVLRSGSLVAPVKVLEERTIGPSLGQESINAGIRSAIYGALAVFLFTLIYYRGSGVVACFALFLNILFILSFLAGFGASLTLPGLAGIALTVGMAIDANVLIFERIREELERGLSPYDATAEGFSKAALTIFDANLTTLIVAAILYQFGTGPVRGFAITLSIGIIASMFTAIFVSKVIFDFWITKQKTHLSI